MKARSQAKEARREDTAEVEKSNTKKSATSSNRPTPFTTKHTASIGLVSVPGGLLPG